MFIKLVSYTHQNLQTDSQSAQLSVIAGVIIHLAMPMTLWQQSCNRRTASKDDTGDNINMQKQIDYLTSEIEKIKKQMDRPRK